MSCAIESFDINSVGCLLHVEYPNQLQVEWDIVCQSIPGIVRGNCYCNQQNCLEIKINECVPPNIKDNRLERKTVVTISSAGISISDWKRLVNALIQRYHLWNKLISIHSVIVGLEGKAIALLGGFGDGKTITSLKMEEKGANLLASDLGVLNIDPSGKPTVVVGGSKPVMIRPALLRSHFQTWYKQLLQRVEVLHLEKVDVSEFVRGSNYKDGEYELTALVYVKVAPVNEEYRVCEKIQRATARWPVINFWSATGYYFDQVILGCNYPLSLLQSPSDIKYRWECSSKVVSEHLVYHLFGNLEYVAEQAMEILLKQ